jgi:hypothetical protein
MPSFMQVVNIRLEHGGHTLYNNGPTSAVDVSPGTYEVRATLRAAPTYTIYGSSADLTLTCDGSPAAAITLRVPDPSEWGLRADIYTFTSASWPPFGATYTLRGTWSVGAIYFWVVSSGGGPVNPVVTMMPYFTRVSSSNTAPKWAAYWINTPWTNWAIKFTGRLYVPWSNIRVGVWQDDGVYVRLCSINTGSSRWTYTPPAFYTTSGTCTGAPGIYSVEVGYFQGAGQAVLVFVIGQVGSDKAYIPTIDGAWYCEDFRWAGAQQGTCSVGWSFLPSS